MRDLKALFECFDLQLSIYIHFRCHSPSYDASDPSERITFFSYDYECGSLRRQCSCVITCFTSMGFGIDAVRMS